MEKIDFALIHQFIQFQVASVPHATAIIFQNEKLSYQELNQKANQVAHYLRKLGVKPEVLVGVCVERSLDMVIALLGILKAGGAYVPLDPTYPKERLAFVIEDTQIPILLTQQHLLESIPQHQAQTVCIDDNWQKIAQQSVDNPICETQPHNLAYIIYTSGSTGKPKGVAIEHRNTVALINWARKLFTPEQLKGVLCSTSLCFDLSIFELFVTLSYGGKVILAQDALQLPNLPAASQVTLINTVPSVISALLRMNGIPSSVNTINLAGEPLQNALVQQLYQLEHIQQVFNLYGPTEDTTYSTVALIQKGGNQIPSIGRPIANTQIYLLDSRLNPVADGAEGEIYITGAGVARGYLNSPELTNDKFVINPFSNEPGSRLYKTGDLAVYLPNGNLKFLGRIDHQVKIRGFRIELGEIEARLNEHPAVNQAIVVTREDVLGSQRLISYVVPNSVGDRQLQDISPKALRSFLRQKLPNYMIPSAFFLLDELPLTLNGKIDRRALPVPKYFQRESENYIAPRTSLEKQLAEIWTHLLGIELISIDDTFCELGGSSLLTIQLIVELRQTFQLDITLENFLNLPTVAGLAQTITALSQTEIVIQPTNPLEKEILLDSSIQPRNTLSEPVLNFFLTGATGFLGAFLLYDLLQQTRADIYCLVRASSLEEARVRIISRLKLYQLWQEDLRDRIIPVVGDLSKPLLGLEAQQFSRLAEKIDIIYHCGASVNMVYPYSALESMNVLGTQEVLRLASQNKIKPLHFISTVDVLSSTKNGIAIVREEDTNTVACDTHLHSGYAQSKYIAEQLVMMAHSRGLPCSIYRPSNITGHSKTGICSTTSFLARMINSCIQMGIVPELEAVLNLVPVDYVSQAIAHLSHQHKICGKVLYIVNPEPIEWRQLVNWMENIGYSLQRVSYQVWYDRLSQLIKCNSENSLSPLVSVLTPNFVQKLLGVFQFKCESTHNELNNNSIYCPPANEELLQAYFSYFIQTGYLQAPVSSSKWKHLVFSENLKNLNVSVSKF
ncbi:MULTISPECIES: amino acid adenylation domain-containing protein [unclassified Nostoc]|uniref:non-ribosomal peptide synthetase family protein n=1 Tax=unclassified Nostoc TaxID=2593658 RepID=UPI002AD33D10|nr:MULTISPECIES: amino acid adenylation domain-containing protein [unclassified Nostoc]MDZ8126202.1 amino acid adenylation domain-containing protein [Nostoc sp. CmiVER01]MDZ8221822.1 amino acid adenylation domain-containing protein [Nostoc sp. ChiVER01]